MIYVTDVKSRRLKQSVKRFVYEFNRDKIIRLKLTVCSVVYMHLLFTSVMMRHVESKNWNKYCVLCGVCECDHVHRLFRVVVERYSAFPSNSNTILICLLASVSKRFGFRKRCMLLRACFICYCGVNGTSGINTNTEIHARNG